LQYLHDTFVYDFGKQDKESKEPNTNPTKPVLPNRQQSLIIFNIYVPLVTIVFANERFMQTELWDLSSFRHNARQGGGREMLYNAL